MKRAVSLLLAAALSLLCACSGSDTADVCAVYRVLDEERQTDGQLLCTEPLSPAEGESTLDAALRALDSETARPGSYNPAAGLVVGCTLDGGTATLEMDEGYFQLSGVDKTLADACCALTLCSLPDIERVNIVCGGQIVTQGLNNSDMLLDSSGTAAQRSELCLYYTDAGGLFIPEYRTLQLTGSSQAERYIVESLASPPSGGQLFSPLPEGTELLGVSVSGRKCTLSLSGEFIDNRAGTISGEVAALYSIVNSITSIGGIREVVITVEGHSTGTYAGIPLDEPLTTLEFASVRDIPPGSEHSCRIYFRAGDALCALPCIVSADAPVQDMLGLLMSAGRVGGCSPLFTEDDELTHVATQLGICTVSVSRSFFERRSEQEASLAVDALLLSLFGLDGVYAVRLVYDDGSVPLMPGRDLSVPVFFAEAEIID